MAEDKKLTLELEEGSDYSYHVKDERGEIVGRVEAVDEGDWLGSVYFGELRPSKESAFDYVNRTYNEVYG